MPRRVMKGRKRGRVGGMSDENYMTSDLSMLQGRVDRSNSAMSRQMAERAGGYRKAGRGGRKSTR